MVTRKQSQSVLLRNKALLRRIQGIKSEHPAWGYRRVWAYLRYREGFLVNKNASTGCSAKTICSQRRPEIIEPNAPQLALSQELTSLMKSGEST